MKPRATVLLGALAIALAASASTPATGVPSLRQDPVGFSTRSAPEARSDEGLERLRSDANGRLRVQRGADGAVDSVSSRNGRAMLDAQGTTTARSTVLDQLATHGAAFGLDGSTSRAVVTRTFDSATGGSVVRSQQVMDDLPVFGGQIVMSLDENQGVVSIDAATSAAPVQVPAPVVSEARARRTALAVVARTHGEGVDALRVSDRGRQLYDPALVHTFDPMGVRPVWEFEVTDGFQVRETVLVGTGKGEIALHFNDAPQLNRRICDNANSRTVSSSSLVPVCATPARTENGAASGNPDVNLAFANLGATSDAYAQLGGIDLTNLIGRQVSGIKSLLSTVRWCFADFACPFANAFWDGTQMVFGSGYAGADDVVAHELTHGYVERTANLFALHQSGALNESLADTIGEIVDHRNAASPQDDSAWTVGEDLGVPGATRSMKDPTLTGQPDRMGSPLYVSADAEEDSGAVHANNGVGNKTAYLISQGGSFNGEVVQGIDGSDAGLAKTGRLYLETIPRLTSGSEYADLGRVLTNTCAELAATSTGGFTSGDCESVRAAVVATELSASPQDATAAAAEAPVSCPAGSSVQTVIARDDDGLDGFDFSSSSVLWGRAPFGFVPSYAVSGSESLFAFDPDPELGDPSSGSLTSAPFTVPSASGGAYLNFHHAYVMDHYAGSYFDGGRLAVSRLVDGVWTPVTGLPWTNGPTRHIEGSTPAGFTGFGGDSRGYGSSQVDLSSLAGDRVQVSFEVEGDSRVSYYGWWIDDVRLYGCDTAALAPSGPLAPSTPRAPAATTSAYSAVISWGAPVDRGSAAVVSYRVTRSDGQEKVVPAASLSAKLDGLDRSNIMEVSIAAINGDALSGPPATVRIYPTKTVVTSSTSRAARNKLFRLTAKVTQRDSSAAVGTMALGLQRRFPGGSWRNLSSGTTGASGTKTWSLRQTRSTYYRVVARGGEGGFGSLSATRLVRRR